MDLNIVDLEPSVISKDLKGKFVCIYSMPKMGKTTLACQFPKNLLLGFEHGWNALSGVYALDVTKWADFKLILRQLEKPEAKEKYNTITIDTVGIAYDLCEQYICAQQGVQKISDVEWGAGYNFAKKEFENCLRKITQLGYGLVIIAHVDFRKEKTSNETETLIIAPSIPKRAYEIVNRLVDVIGYIDIEYDDEGQGERYLYTRKTPTIMAGSRFPHLAPKIKFGYNELVEALTDAIEKSRTIDGANIVDKIEQSEIRTLNFEEIRSECQKLWMELIAIDQENADKILKKVEIIFGRKMRLSEITEDQVDLFELVRLDMVDMLSK